MRSPAQEQQHALTIRYEQPPERWAAPRIEADERTEGTQAAAALRRAIRRTVTAVRGIVSAGGRTLAASIHAVTSRLRARLVSPPAAQTTGAEQAARRTRHALRARAANRLTPLRALGWLLWGGAAALLVLVVAAPERAAQHLPILSVLGPPAPAAPPALTVEARLDRYVLSAQGPAVLVSGSIRNDGDTVTPALLIEAGLGAEAVPLPAVPLPPGGERPFAVRVLVPEAARGVRLSVRSAEHATTATPTADGFRVQERGGAWPTGHAGPPASR